jgi:hypothetical protein
MIAWLTCLFMGHLWEARSYGPDQYPGERAARRDWQVCLRCDKDTREIWEIQDDNLIRLERIEMQIRGRNL